MGIPKFFRFMSERYPLISQLIQENRIPEFDALYLDMNGIIHNCSHPDDTNASFRITEEAIFLAVFNYISHLFSVIKPQKLFFLAVDGVAPRAKMNQQRSRRFRTAKEAKEVLDKAKRKGEEIPDGEGFDSNCITPGTPFMARLSEQLKYFLAKKVTEDADWRGVEIVLSGHEVPGEGEHKIMEYIRLRKAQPDYDANVRHCLYGLDADLIMLGLLSHDPHFCLLREEVKFGPQKGKKGSLEAQNFFLMHLSLFREYLDLEFSSLKTASPPLPFEYDLERIIDDFILLNIFVGNDFLPHLPGLHINEGALGRLFEIYKRVLPVAGGYLNEHGILNVKRLQLVLNELTIFEKEHFEHEFADTNWFKIKQKKPSEAMEKARARNKLVITKEQRALLGQIKAFVKTNLRHPSPNARLELPASLPASDKRFLSDLGESLRLSLTYDEFDEDDQPLIVVSFDEELVANARPEDSEEEEAMQNGEAEWQRAILRVLKKYDKAETAKDFDEEAFEEEQNKQIEERMAKWKNDYYLEKLGFPLSDQDAVDDIAYRYIEGLQWVLHYYYDGVVSWGWFYNYHYAPKISDLNKAASYEFSFDLGYPFKPFEQLMGVLPQLSSAHIPRAFRDLMSDTTSPIIDFYPVDFLLDMNGKKQEWEAIVKIPFIDEKRLLKTMAAREVRLTDEERSRNTFGDSWRFTYDESRERVYPSSLPGFFPDILQCRTVVEPFHLPTLAGGLSFVKGLVPGVLLGADAISGFPSMHTIPFTGQLGFHGVSIFQQDSKKETMVITIDNQFDGLVSESVAQLLVGKRMFVGYPYLKEAHVTAVSDELFRYEVQQMSPGNYRVFSTPHSGPAVMEWKRSADKLEHTASKKQGVMIGHVEMLVHAQLIKGLKRLDDGSTVKEFEDVEQEFALQTVVTRISNEDVRFMERDAIPVELEYPEGCKVFFLGEGAYGLPAQVIAHEDGKLVIRVAYFPGENEERARFKARIAEAGETEYLPSHFVSRQLHMSGLTLSKITSSMMLNHGDSKLNVGLNLKFEAKSQKVLGYTRKGDSGWQFSSKAVKLIEDYKNSFPEIINALDNAGRKDMTQATDFFGRDHVDERVKALRAWISDNGVRDLEKVPLWSEQLEKSAVEGIEKLADKLNGQKDMAHVKIVLIKAIPRSALLKPAHASSRLRDQRFDLGDRVIIVSESGSVPLSAKGVVVGLHTGFVDVVFDCQFIGGTTLGDRCSQYRGATVSPSTILNLTAIQFAVKTGPELPAPPTSAARKVGPSTPHFKKGPLGGPSILPASGLPAGGFHPAPNRGRGSGHQNGGVQVLKNPARDFNPNAYGAVARGEAPQRDTVSSSTPSHFSQQQKLGAVLGISASNARPTHAPRNHHQNGNGHQHSHAQTGAGNALEALFTAAKRGAPGGGFKAVPHGSGVSIAPPPALLNGHTGHKGRGRGRGAAASGGA